MRLQEKKVEKIRHGIANAPEPLMLNPSGAMPGNLLHLLQEITLRHKRPLIILGYLKLDVCYTPENGMTVKKRFAGKMLVENSFEPKSAFYFFSLADKDGIRNCFTGQAV